jgi:glycosyltransferase involved in cell wall biosynthesis
VKLVVDAMSASYGGIATYVDNLLRAWPQLYPDDELHVVVPQGTGSTPRNGVHVHELTAPRPAVLSRPLAQTSRLPGIVRQVGADAVLATLPSTTLRSPGVPLVVVVHDLRHELRPEQFSLPRRALRSVSYGRAYAMADAFVAVSQRTLDDLHAQRPRTRSIPATVVYHGADHAAGWTGAAAAPYAIAQGHHSNKNVDLVLEAWSLVASRGAVPRLRVLGLPSGRRTEIAAAVQRLGLAEFVELSPYLPEAEFESVMAGAKLLVFPSDFEGFGLPVLESMLLGIPVVVGPDRAVLEIAGGHATVMSDWSVTALANSVEQALTVDADALVRAAAHARQFTWGRTAELTRAAITAAVAGSR